jgi:hypothetical protein
VKISTEKQPFKNDRHAWSGRLFAAHKSKLLLTYICFNFDIEPLAERPCGRCVVDVSIPDKKPSIKAGRKDHAIEADRRLSGPDLSHVSMCSH